MVRRSLTLFSVVMMMVSMLAWSPALAQEEPSIFTETSGFATKTGYRFVFAWEATQQVVPQVEFGTDPGNLNRTATPIPPGIPDTAGLALADDRSLIGQTIFWRVRDLLTDEVSDTKSFVARNAYTAWDPVDESYTINLLIQLDSQSLPPEIDPDVALEDIAEGVNVFAERLFDMLDGHAKLGEVLITDTTTDYNGALPFLINFVNLNECVPATTNVADVIVSTAQPFASQTFRWAINDPCQAFVIGRLGQLVIPWTDDLHMGGVAAHEMGHYAFGAPDLYNVADITQSEPNFGDGIPWCRNLEWDGSMMHNTGGWNGAIWELTELDRNPVTTPCDHEGAPYSWDVLRTRYGNVPESPATGPVGFGIDHIFDPLARGNEDGGMLNMCILDREPGSSTYTCVEPDDGTPLPPGEPCVEPGVLIMGDAEGDFTTVVGTSGHDIRELRIAEPNDIGPGNVVFTLKMQDLSIVPPNSSWPILFADQNGMDRWVRMDNVTGIIRFTYGTGSQSALTSPGSPADAQSSFDPDGTIRIVVPRSAIGNPAPGQTITSFIVRVRVEPGLTPDNMPDSLSRAGGYTFVGSENCTADGLPPVAVDDEAETDQNSPVTIEVLANDTDPEDDPLTVTGVSDPANGTATINPDDTVTYEPDFGFFGEDSFTYTISDGNGGADTATVFITVHPVDPTGGGKVTGDGFLLSTTDARINFGFNAQEKSNGDLHANLRLNDEEAGVGIHLKDLTAIGELTGPCGTITEGTDGTKEFRGFGTINGEDAEFRVCVEDNGEPTNDGPAEIPDKFYLECLTGCGYSTGARTPDDFIDGGDIRVHR